MCIDMSEHSDWNYGEPCPDCGSKILGETCKAHGTLQVSEYPEGSGEWGPERFDVGDMGEPLIVQCIECDTVLMNRIE